MIFWVNIIMKVGNYAISISYLALYYTSRIIVASLVAVVFTSKALFFYNNFNGIVIKHIFIFAF